MMDWQACTLEQTVAELGRLSRELSDWSSLPFGTRLQHEAAYVDGIHALMRKEGYERHLRNCCEWLSEYGATPQRRELTREIAQFSFASALLPTTDHR